VEASIKHAIEEHKSIFEFNTRRDSALEVGYAEAIAAVRMIQLGHDVPVCEC
jgi:hypothetical protein